MDLVRNQLSTGRKVRVLIIADAFSVSLRPPIRVLAIEAKILAGLGARLQNRWPLT